MSIAMADRVS